MFGAAVVVGAIAFVLVRVATSRAQMQAAIEQVATDLEMAGCVSVGMSGGQEQRIIQSTCYVLRDVQ